MEYTEIGMSYLSLLPYKLSLYGSDKKKLLKLTIVNDSSSVGLFMLRHGT